MISFNIIKSLIIFLLSPLRKHYRVGKRAAGNLLTMSTRFPILETRLELLVSSFPVFWIKSGGANTGLFFYSLIRYSRKVKCNRTVSEECITPSRRD